MSFWTAITVIAIVGMVLSYKTAKLQVVKKSKTLNGEAQDSLSSIEQEVTLLKDRVEVLEKILVEQEKQRPYEELARQRG